MIVPNYVPDQLEVPGNVAEQPYPARIAFIRRVVLVYVASVGIAGVFSQGSPFQWGIWLSLAVLGTCLVLLEIWRILTRGRVIEGVVSAGSLVVLLPVVGIAVAAVRDSGLPVWHLLAAPICIGIYTLLCGRDFSFMGCYLLSLIASSVAMASIGMTVGASTRDMTFALGTNLLFLSYIVYDLASLLSRRRIGEHFAAVTDLYRDVLNFFGYFVRIVRHWRRHRIWTVPEFDVPWRQESR